MPKPMKRIDRPKPKPLAPDDPGSRDLNALASLWQSLKRQSTVASQAEDMQSKGLKEALNESGVPDGNGNLWINDLDFPGFDNKGNPAKYNALELRRRRSVGFDHDEAVAVLEERKLLEECSSPKLVITDPEKLLAELVGAGLIEDDAEGNTLVCDGIDIVPEIDQQAVEEAYLAGRITEDEHKQVFPIKDTWALYPGAR